MRTTHCFRNHADGQTLGAPLSRAYESELQRFRRRLQESRERIRREVRDSRARSRLSHQNAPCSEEQRIVSDGLLYTSQRDVDLHSNIHQHVDNQGNNEYRNAEAHVINLEEVCTFIDNCSLFTILFKDYFRVFYCMSYY